MGNNNTVLQPLRFSSNYSKAEMVACIVIIPVFKRVYVHADAC